ncbi:MAG TPA: hypothetical protein VES20_25635 [Bryobacteraceae bacterium]|nr:hypothetical protein [Bryobacteraceae bacterium]
MANTEQTPRSSETRTLHFDLSHCPKDIRHTLNIGLQRQELVPHDERSRSEHRSKVKLLSQVPDERLTHYATLPMPSEAVQSYWITSSKNGTDLPGMSLACIHLPKQAVVAHHRKKGIANSIHSSKAKQLGLLQADGSAPPWIHDGDLADIVNLTDAAKFIVFHHPELVCFEPATVAEALSKIESTRAFGALVKAMAEAGGVVDPDKAEEGYVGWATAGYTLDPDGKKIRVTDVSKPLDQQPEGLGFQWAYDYDESVKEAMKPVVREALRLMRNDPEMEGVSFQTTFGSHAFDESSQVGGANSTNPARVRRFAIQPSVSSAGGYEFSLDNPGWGNGFQVEIVSSKGRQFRLKVSNSFFLYRSVAVRFLGQDKSPIALSDLPDDQRPPRTFERADTKYDSFQAIAKPRQRIMGVPVEASSSREFTVTIPNDAAYMEIVIASPSMDSHIPATYEGIDTPARVQTYFLCYALPSFLLALGIGTAVVANVPVVTFIEQIASDLVEAAMTPIMQAVLHSGQTPAEIGAAFWAMAPRMGGRLAASVAATLVYFYAAAGTANTTVAFPLAKAVFLAVAAAGVAAEMIETTINLAETPRIASRTVSAVIPVNVTVGHDPEDYQFPEGALHYKLSVTPSGGTPSVFEGELESPKVDTINHTFQVTAGGRVTVEAQFSDPETGWVGGYGVSDPIPNVLPEGKESLDISFNITENLVPLDQQTSYRHVEKLAYSNGRHIWVKTSTPPVNTIHSLGGNKAVALADLDHITINMKGRLGYVWKGISPKLLPADVPGTGSVPLHTLQTISLSGTDPDQFLRILGNGSGAQVGYSQPVFLQYDLLGAADGLHFCVAPRSVNGNWEYHAHRISLNETGPIDLAHAPSWGTFASRRISDIAVHPRGVLVALNSDQEKVELLNIPDSPTDNLSQAVPATQASGFGSYLGLLHGAKAMAMTLDGNTFLVLEEVNARIQAFTVSNSSVEYFAGAAAVSLNQGQDDPHTKITYLDMSLEYGGYIYVLSYTGAGEDWRNYRMDIYNPEGRFLTRVQGVPAAKLVVDKWRVVYTENFELLEGPQQRPEPTVSAWAARASA